MTIPLDSAAELIRLQQSGAITAVEIAKAALDRISQTEASVRAYTYRLDPVSVLEQAERIDSRRVSGGPLGALAGIPVAVKDVLCTEDMPTTCSSKILKDFVSPYEATVVTKLREADAILLAKTNLDEFAMGASTENSAFGPTRNPWDTSRTPGGSSGGAAAAVAASNVPLSLGTDTGGSIRQPAAFCSLTGMKPTYGRVSRYGLVAFASSLDQVGPISWDIEDCALLLQAISGFDSRDSTSLDVPVPNFSAACESKDLKGLRCGVLRDALESDGLDAEVRAGIEQAIETMRSLGAEIVDVSLPHSRYSVAAYYVIAPCEASSNLSRYDGAHYGRRADVSAAEAKSGGPLLSMYCKSREEGFGAEVKRRIMVGTYALSTGYYDAYYLQALKVRRLIRGDYDAAFQHCDVLLGPTTPSPPFAFGEKSDDPIEMYLCDLFTVGANLAGIPAVSVPGGFSSAGLPLGLQVQAPPLEEERLIRVAAAFQSVTTHHQRRPES
jgi:aspartyl-tRNA(Asn)/glutamyl-tRNA(Gln) amidotransferase subunit A